MSYEYEAAVGNDSREVWLAIMKCVTANTFGSSETPNEQRVKFYFSPNQNSWGCDVEVFCRDGRLLLSFHSATGEQRRFIIDKIDEVLSGGGFDALSEC